MTTVQEFRAEAGDRSKSVLNGVADIMESMNKKNLAVAREVTGFAISQVRLPTKAKDVRDYAKRSKDAYVKLGDHLKDHTSDYIEILKNVPGRLSDSFSADIEKPAKKVSKKKVAKAA